VQEEKKKQKKGNMNANLLLGGDQPDDRRGSLGKLAKGGLVGTKEAVLGTNQLAGQRKNPGPKGRKVRCRKQTN